jgi:hypothetical protein
MHRLPLAPQSLLWSSPPSSPSCIVIRSHIDGADEVVISTPPAPPADQSFQDLEDWFRLELRSSASIMFLQGIS